MDGSRPGTPQDCMFMASGVIPAVGAWLGRTHIRTRTQRNPLNEWPCHSNYRAATSLIPLSNLSCFNLNKGEIIDVCVCVCVCNSKCNGFAYLQIPVYILYFCRVYFNCSSLFWIKLPCGHVSVCAGSDDRRPPHQYQLVMDSVVRTRWFVRIDTLT